MARRVASGLAGLASAARLHLARGSAVLRGAGARVAEPDRPVGEASRRSAPASGEDEDGPLRWYRRRVREGALRADARQVEALERLQDFRSRLAAPRGALLGREHAPWRLGADDAGVFGSHDGHQEPRSQGVYLHGGVGPHDRVEELGPVGLEVELDADGGARQLRNPAEEGGPRGGNVCGKYEQHSAV